MPGIYSCLDLASAVESSQNSGLWAVTGLSGTNAFSGDGLHPTTIALKAEASSIADIFAATPMLSVSGGYVNGPLNVQGSVTATNFSGNFTGTLSGNATTATTATTASTATTAQSIPLSGLPSSVVTNGQAGVNFTNFTASGDFNFSGGVIKSSGAGLYNNGMYWDAAGNFYATSLTSFTTIADAYGFLPASTNLATLSDLASTFTSNGAGLTNLQSTNLSGAIPANLLATNTPSAGSLITSPDGTNNMYTRALYYNAATNTLGNTNQNAGLNFPGTNNLGTLNVPGVATLLNPSNRFAGNGAGLTNFYFSLSGGCDGGISASTVEYTVPINSVVATALGSQLLHRIAMSFLFSSSGMLTNINLCPLDQYNGAGLIAGTNMVIRLYTNTPGAATYALAASVMMFGNSTLYESNFPIAVPFIKGQRMFQTASNNSTGSTTLGISTTLSGTKTQ